MDAVVAEPVEQDAAVRDRPFNPNRVAKSERSKGVVAEALRLLQNYETHFRARVRKRRRHDQITFEATVGALVCDLIHRELTAPGAWLAVPLSKTVLGRRDRYGSRVLGKTLPTILRCMTAPEMDYAEMIKGAPGPFGTSRQTTMRAGSR